MHLEKKTFENILANRRIAHKDSILIKLLIKSGFIYFCPNLFKIVCVRFVVCQEREQVRFVNTLSPIDMITKIIFSLFTGTLWINVFYWHLVSIEKTLRLERHMVQTLLYGKPFIRLQLKCLLKYTQNSDHVFYPSYCF